MDFLPIARVKALLVQIVKTALNLLVSLIFIAWIAYGTAFHVRIVLVTCCIKKRAAESLELVELFLFKELFNDL